MIRIQWALLAGAALSLGCTDASLAGRGGAVSAVESSHDGGPPLATRRDAAGPAVTALQQGRFEEADKLAAECVSADSGNPYARMVRAIVRYKKSTHQLVLDGETVLIGGLEAGNLNQKYLKGALQEAESELATVDADLAVVAGEPEFSIDLCIACWKIDWNANGRIDSRDTRLAQIEVDEKGQDIPEDDPRRNPTFHFDAGDVAWARAFVSFQRAAIDVLLAYDWSEVALLAGHGDEKPEKIVVRLVEPDRIAKAKVRLLEGLAQSDACRRAYLAETDDDREWVPNPRQKNHPMPLPVDQALYDTWEGVVGDVRKLAEGEEGLSVADLFTLAEEHPKPTPTGFIDVGKMLSHPKDIVLDIDDLEALDRGRHVDRTLAETFGEYYVRSMKPSALPKRLIRMKGEVDKLDGEMDRKLRYLFWLN